MTKDRNYGTTGDKLDDILNKANNYNNSRENSIDNLLSKSNEKVNEYSNLNNPNLSKQQTLNNLIPEPTNFETFRNSPLRNTQQNNNPLSNSQGSYNFNTFQKFDSSPNDITTLKSENMRLKIENENLENQVKTLKNLLDDEKRKSYQTNELDQDKLKKILNENEDFIHDLKKKHKQELKDLEERYKNNLNSINEEKRKIKLDYEKDLINEKEKIKMLNNAEIENMESIHKKHLEEQKDFYTKQNEILNQRLQQQIELNKLATKVESSSKLVEDIVSKYQSDKEQMLKSEKYLIDNKEKYLLEQEERLRKLEDSLSQEKENLLKSKKDIELQ